MNPEPVFLSRLAHPTVNGRARLEALAALAGRRSSPTDLVDFHSGGMLLVIGGEERVKALVSRLPNGLTPILLTPMDTGAPTGFDKLDGIPRIRGALSGLTGHLGDFRPVFEGAEGGTDLAQVTGGWCRSVDLVLDRSATPWIDSPVPPTGYFAPRNEDALAAALEELSAFTGDFEKPRYFNYDPEICAHGRSGIRACTRCLEACPTDAISSLGNRIEADPYLCQGYGSCATACPTGAITYAYPRLSDTLSALRALLHAYREAGGHGPRLLFHDGEQGICLLEEMAGELPEDMIPFEVEEVGGVGMDVWLAALAYGAGVGLLVPEGVPERVMDEIEAQIGYAHALLQGMGLPATLLQTIRYQSAETTIEALRGIARLHTAEVAEFAPLDDKRRVIHLAVDHLQGQAPAPRSMITLPTGAPFGEVWLDEERCTLCMACVSQCPGKALEAGGDTPRLSFIEDNCVQCALCARSCPENAIAPTPRYLFNPVARQERRVLKQEEPFYCIQCGKPFATRSVIDQMTLRLRDHPMFQGNGLRRLRMCEDCRVKVMFDEDLAANDTEEEKP